MKKIFKALIALVIIVALAVGAYFVFKGKDGSITIYNNVYNLSYSVKQDEDNVVNKVNLAVENMLNIIEANSLSIPETQKNLQVFKCLKDGYSYINAEILCNGCFLMKNDSMVDYINNASNSLNNVKKIYLDCYGYLKNTYFKIVNTEYNVATMKDYIVNFENLFKEILNDYNSFFYNSSIAYSHCLNNTMLKNNAYKLSVEYSANLINEFYKSTQSYKNNIFAEAQKVLAKLNGDFSEEYFQNKEVFDNLINISLTINVGEICIQYVSGGISAYIAKLPEADRVIVNNYVKNVIGG